MCEPIPAIDLNVPKPVVLASLYHALDEAMEILDDVVKFLKDVEIPSWENIKEDIVEDIDPIIPGIEDEAKFLSDFAACKKMLKILWDFYIINLQLGPGSLVAWFKKDILDL